MRGVVLSLYEVSWFTLIRHHHGPQGRMPLCGHPTRTQLVQVRWQCLSRAAGCSGRSRRGCGYSVTAHRLFVVAAVRPLHPTAPFVLLVCHSAALALVLMHGLVTCRGQCKSSHWYVPSPLSSRALVHVCLPVLKPGTKKLCVRSPTLFAVRDAVVPWPHNRLLDHTAAYGSYLDIPPSLYLATAAFTRCVATCRRAFLWALSHHCSCHATETR